jgi:PIN domain nuclease of toxin-antitoxin system
MRLLIDTNALIWFANGDNKLSSKAIKTIEDSSNGKYVSIGSLWEMAIKKSLGKLVLNFNLKDLPQILINNNIQLLNISADHAIEIENLPLIHRDPFDRILIVQALMEKMDVVSIDEIFDEYFENTSIKRIW